MLPFLLACTPGVVPSAGGPVARFHLEGGRALFDAPFPSVHRQQERGLDALDWPNPNALPFVADLVDATTSATGAGTTSGVLFAFEDAVQLRPVDVWSSVKPDAPAFLVALDTGERVPVDLWYDESGGPFGVPHLVTLLPLQGFPLRPGTAYAAVLRRELGKDGPLGVPDELRDLVAHRRPEGVSREVADAYEAALAAIDRPEDVAALAVFVTGDPTAEFLEYVADARSRPPPLPDAPLALVETFDTYCVFASTVEMPDYQAGEPPFLSGGGAWARDDEGRPEVQRTDTARIVVTIPRSPMPAGGWPVTVMVRTGGGGDRPLVDRGVQAETGGEALVPGSGPAMDFAAVGYAGVEVDGPLGGPYRNPSGADEQFLVFNVGNPIGTRDNVRQSALELALLPPVLDGLHLDASGCDGTTADAVLSTDTLALLGHSMGATIAPLTLAAAPEFRLAVLSGFGGSYLDNLIYKEDPLEVKPLAEALLGYTAIGRSLVEGDPVLQLLQWASEPADPPVYARLVAAHLLMEQGIVDHYILPPMANAASLSYGLDLALPPLDATTPELASMRPLEPLLPLVDRTTLDLPAGGNRDDVTRIVAQHPSDGIEDGHEVLFQTEPPKHQLRCVLADLAAGRTPVVREDGPEDAPCD